MLTINDFVGRNIGGYTITAQLASSASSTVLLGERTHPDHLFAAIKWLHSTHIASFEGQEGFFHEVRRVRRLQHPFIVPNLGAGIENSTPYLISAYAPNGSLRQNMHAHSPWLQLVDNAITLIAQAGQALHHAHQHDIVHGNLKPENILLNGRGKVWLTDFHLSSLNPYNTRLLAAPMSSAQKERLPTELHLEDTAIISKENDIHALASITYELLTGRKPYMTPSVNNPGHQYKLKALIPPRRHNAAIPLHIEQTLLRALSKDPAPRYTDVMDFLADLGSSLDLDDSLDDQPASTLKIVVVSALTAQAEPVPVGESAPTAAVTPANAEQETVAAIASAGSINPTSATFSSPVWVFSPETPVSDVTSLPTSSLTPVAPVLEDVSTPAASFSSVAQVPDATSTPASISTPAISSLDTVPMPAASALPETVNADSPGDGLTFVSPAPVFSGSDGSGTAFASYNPATYEQGYQAAFSPYTPVPERPEPGGLKLNKRKLVVLLALICLILFVSVGGVWAFTSSLQPVQQGNNQLQTPEPTQGGSLTGVATQTATLTETPTQEPTPQSTPTSEPTPTPQSTPTSEPTPTPTVKPTPTPTSEPVPPNGFAVSPSRLSKSNCSNSRGNYVCVVQLSLAGKSGESVTWIAYSSGVRASIRPSVGTISPGETVSVTITIDGSCSSSGSIRFVTTKEDASVSWKC